MKLFKLFSRSLILIATLVVGVQSTKADLIELDLSGIANISPEVVARFGMAEQFWENQLVGYSNELPKYILGQLGTIRMSFSGQAIDGAGGVLGAAGVDPASVVRWTQGGGKGSAQLNRAISQGGSGMFDTDDYGEGLLFLPDRVIIHEMGHVLGFGSLWSDADNSGLLSVRPPDPRGGPGYVGRYGLEKWREVSGDKFAPYVPIEKLGGAGTRDAHWDSQHPYFRRNREIMGGFDTGPNWKFTIMSTWAMRDLGFATAYGEVGNIGNGPLRPRGPKNGPGDPNDPAFLRGGGSSSVPEPASASLIGLIGICGLGLIRRRRK